MFNFSLSPLLSFFLFSLFFFSPFSFILCNFCYYSFTSFFFLFQTKIPMWFSMITMGHHTALPSLVPVFHEYYKVIPWGRGKTLFLQIMWWNSGANWISSSSKHQTELICCLHTPLHFILFLFSYIAFYWALIGSHLLCCKISFSFSIFSIDISRLVPNLISLKILFISYCFYFHSF